MSTSVASSRSLLIMPILILLFLLQGTANADRVDRLMTQLAKNQDYKVRVSAALNLAKLGDKRGVPALIDALRDRDKNVRSVAATSLAKLISRRTPASLRTRARKALEVASSKDRDPFVRKQAQSALRQIENSGGKGGGIYVHIGPMSAKTKTAPAAIRTLMRDTARNTISKRATSMKTTWSSGKPPSETQLRASRTAGYHVDGTLLSLKIESKGGTTLVSCKISMLIATFPEKSMFGFLDGGARVQTGSSPKDIQYAQEDCVAAVVEDLVAKKVIPVIQQRH